MGAKHAPIAERFWRYVTKTNTCWIWTGAKGGGKRYGSFNVGPGAKAMLAHRASWLIHYGDPGKQCILHKCDNTFCVRPEHLFIGSQLDNIQDMCQKQRQAGPRGERAHKAKLSIADVCAIRTLKDAGRTTKELAEEFRVKRQTIWAVTCGRSWGHV